MGHRARSDITNMITSIKFSEVEPQKILITTQHCRRGENRLWTCAGARSSQATPSRTAQGAPCVATPGATCHGGCSAVTELQETELHTKDTNSGCTLLCSARVIMKCEASAAPYTHSPAHAAHIHMSVLVLLVVLVNRVGHTLIHGGCKRDEVAGRAVCTSGG